MNNPEDGFVWANVSELSDETKGQLLNLGLMGYNVIDILILTELLEEHPEIKAEEVWSRFIEEGKITNE